MSRIVLLTLTLLLLALPGAAARADPAADLREMSLYRGFADQPFVFDLTVSTFRGGKQVGPTQQSSVYFRDFDAVLVDFSAPASYAGRRILFSGQQMWMALPSSSRSVRISAADRLMGDASNGDILNIDPARYTATALADETLKGVAYKRISAVANDAGVLYPRVDFLLEPGSNRPYRSYHYAASGKVLKVAQYMRFADDGGRERLSQLLLVDPANGGNYTMMQFRNYRTAELPAGMFAQSAIRNPLHQGGE